MDALAEDLDAGASTVITEARESGRSGIARADGHMRTEVLSAILQSIDPAVVMFEAPTKDLQVEMIRQLARRYADRITLDFFGDQLVCHL